jgi:hypothetical protein
MALGPAFQPEVGEAAAPHDARQSTVPHGGKGRRRSKYAGQLKIFFRIEAGKEGNR